MNDSIEYPGTLENALDPREHQNLLGHEEPRRLLELAFTQNRFPQAWLLQGPEGVGKASFAWNYARQLVHFGKVTQQKLPQDIMERFARGSQSAIYDLSLPTDEKGSFKAQITVEQIRGLNEKLSLSATDGGWRVVIIDPAEAMNANAANAVLKLLEEPPAYVVFFLISQASHKLLPTIHSRCQKLRFQELSTQNMQTIWPLVCDEVLPDENRFLLAGGSMRMALSMSAEMSATYGEMITMIKKDLPEELIVQNASTLSTGARNEALNRAQILFQLVFGRLSRFASGIETGGEIETEVAQRIAKNLTRWASLSSETQALLEDAKRLNLQVDVNIINIWFSIKNYLKTL